MPAVKSLWLVLIGIICVSCTAPRLPVYSWTDHQTALQTLASRVGEVKTFSARCVIELTHSNGRAIRLDGVMVSRPPEHFRLRAWKLSHAVFDLTLTPDGLWLIPPDDTAHETSTRAISDAVGQLVGAWPMAIGRSFIDERIEIDDTGGKQFRLRRVSDHGSHSVWTVDRLTLTVRSFELVQTHGDPKITLLFEGHRLVDGVVCPTKLTAIGPDGKIKLWLNDLRLNQSLAAAAFDPPPRAVKQP